VRRPNPNQLALFTERRDARGKLRFAIALKRHFSRRVPTLRRGERVTRAEMRMMHEVCAAAWNSTETPLAPSCAEMDAMSTFCALEAE
jgi:hypothetical protein